MQRIPLLCTAPILRIFNYGIRIGPRLPGCIYAIGVSHDLRGVLPAVGDVIRDLAIFSGGGQAALIGGLRRIKSSLNLRDLLVQ